MSEPTTTERRATDRRAAMTAIRPAAAALFAAAVLAAPGASATELPAGLELVVREQPGQLAGPEAPALGAFPVQLVLDDGSGEGSVGVADAMGAREFLWFNRFDAPPGPGFVLEEVWVLFAADPNVAPGDAIELAVYQDPDGDPSDGADLLATFDVTVQAADGATFSVYPLAAPVTFSGPGDVLIGVVPRFIEPGDPLTSPAAIDTTASQGRSWMAIWTGDPPDDPELPPDSLISTVEDLGFPGNWMIRGFGSELPALEIPAVGGPGLAGLAALLLLAGLVFLLRRRGGAVAALAALALIAPAAARAQVVIDDFDTAQGPLAVQVPPDAVGDADSSSAAAGGGTILGGQRDLLLTFLGGGGSGEQVSAEAAGGELTFAADAGARGSLLLAWDGDTDPATLDPDGLGGDDLTGGGTTGGFRLAVASTIDVQLQLEVYTDADNRSRAALLVPAAGGGVDVFIDFSELVPSPGADGPADLADVGAVTLRLLAENGSVTVGHFETAPPEVAAAQADFTDAGAPIGGGAVVPGETFRYRVTIDNPGGGAEDVDLDNLIDPNLAVGTFRTTPVVRNDHYTGFGNVTLAVDGVALPGLTANDTDPDGDPVDIVAFDAVSAQGGSVALVDSLDGTFDYVPPAGFTGVDSFTYTVGAVAGDPTADAAGNPVGPFTATATIDLSRTVWFVDNTHGGPFEGTQADPFAELKDAETASAPGDVIRLRRGDGTTTGYDLGMIMKAGQHLIGGGVALVIGGEEIEPADPGGRPQVTHGAAGHALELASEHVIHGVDLVDSDLAGMHGVGIGHLEVREASITGAGAEAIDIVDGDLDVELDDVSSDGSPNHGLRLSNVTGTMIVSGATTIANYASNGIQVTNSPGVSVDFGATSVNSSSPFAPPAEGLASPGISLTNSAGATFTFDTLDVAAAGDGLIADTAGTVNVNSTAATLGSTGGAAAFIVDTAGQTNGVSGWTFATLASADSPGNGVRLDGLTDDFLVTTSTTVTDTGTVGILVRNCPGRSIDFGAASVTDTDVGGGATGSGIELTLNVAGATFTFDSLAVVSDGGFGLLADTAGTIHVGGGTNSIAATGGAALDVTDTAVGAGNWTFSALSSSGSPGSGVNLDGVSGGAVTANGGAIAGAAGTAFNVSGGTPAVTYHGTVTQNNPARVVNVESTLGGAVSFPTGKVSGGAASLGVRIHDADGNASFADLDLGTSGSPMASTAVTLSGGSAGTFSFAGTQVFTAGATGIDADDGGTVEMTGAGNRVSASGAGAVSMIGGTTIGASGVTIERVDSTGGAAPGIRLDSTGSVAGSFFSVTGAGGDCKGSAANCSGGTISGKSGSGVDVDSAQDVRLAAMVIDGNATHGIALDDVAGFVFDNARLTNNGDVAGEKGLRGRELSGAVTFTSSHFQGNVEDHVEVVNETNPTTSTVTFTGNLFDANTPGPPGNNAINYASRGTVAKDITFDVRSNTFQNVRATAIQIDAERNTLHDITVGGPDPGDVNVFDNNNVALNLTNNFTGDVVALIENNTLTGHGSSGAGQVINLFTATSASSGSSFKATVRNNRIGTAGVSDSGTPNGNAVRVISQGDTEVQVLIEDNTVHGVTNGGVEGQARDGVASLDLTLRDNDLNFEDSIGVFITGTGDAAGETISICADIGGPGAESNTVVNAELTPFFVFAGVAVQQSASGGGAVTFTLPNFGGGAAAAVETFIDGQNTISTPGAAAAQNVFASGTFAAGGTQCTLP